MGGTGRRSDLSMSLGYLPRLTAICLLAACARGSPRGPAARLPEIDPARRTVRVSLGSVREAVLSATGNWTLHTPSGRQVTRGGSDDHLLVTARDRRLQVARPDRAAAPPGDSVLVLRVTESTGFARFGARRYRGELTLIASDSAVRVVNRVDIDDYLRGVVPREIGNRLPAERAAVEAQAVAARSYALVRANSSGRPYDLTASTADQVYGGADAETALADAAIAATIGLALYYDGRIVSAPYHSTCGGSTAEPGELWRGAAQQPYLRRVSDRIEGTDRYYCDAAPRFRWERTWSGDSLAAVIDRYVRSYAAVPAGALGALRGVVVDARTTSGRAASLLLETERGSYRVRGNDIRYVLRSSSGELLNSTYFSAEPVTGREGRVMRLTVRGVGYGHGVGMCQWGAIGRARRGHDVRAILATYFPGTTIARAY